MNVKAQVAVTKVTMPAGTYFVGDPCYPVSRGDWEAILESNDSFSTPVGTTAAGDDVVGFGTAYGDGEYQDQDGGTYSVDAGLIGVVPEAAFDAGRHDIHDLKTLGRVVTFAEPFVVYEEDGIIHVGRISIDTDTDVEEDDEDEGFDIWGGDDEDED